MMMPAFSVVIPTLNRKEYLIDTLKAIRETQKNMDYEIAIIDQSDNYNREELEAMLHKENLFQEGSLIYYAVSFKSLTKARNFALKHTKGDIILFLDDDIQPYPGLFYEHAKSYSINDKIGSVAGKIIEESYVDTNTNRIGGSVNNLGRSLKNYNSDIDGYILGGPGGNLSLKREVVEKVGCFDIRYIGTSELEETDYCYRVIKAGYKIYYNHNATIKHLLAKSGGCRAEFKERQYYRMHNLGLFFAKHKSPVLLPFLIAFQSLTIFKRIYCNMENNRMSAFFYIIKGLFRGYFITSRAKIENYNSVN